MTYLVAWLLGIPVAAAVLEWVLPVRFERERHAQAVCAILWPVMAIAVVLGVPVGALYLLAQAGAWVSRRLRRKVPRG